jgi:hypothetical protein
MAAILSPLGLYGGNRKKKLPLRPKTKIHAPEGHFGNLRRRTIGRMPGDGTLRSPDASFAILMHALRFEVSRKCRRTPVRLVRPTGLTSLMLLPSVFSLSFVDQPRNPVVFL